jgi:molybdenum cofactor guanylyltransferase
MGSDQRVIGAILAGGASRRFGAPKALARLGGATLLTRVGTALIEAGAEPIVVGGEPDDASSAGYGWLPDASGGPGPLRGLVSALRHTASWGVHGCVCLACDTPFLPPELLRHLVSEAAVTGASAVAAASERNPQGEPLCAWYSTVALAIAESRLAAGDRRMRDLLASLQPVVLSLAEVREYGDPEHIFLNINTADDMEIAADSMTTARRRNG